jgi:hypothetical protein
MILSGARLSQELTGDSDRQSRGRAVVQSGATRELAGYGRALPGIGTVRPPIAHPHGSEGSALGPSASQVIRESAPCHGPSSHPYCNAPASGPSIDASAPMNPRHWIRQKLDPSAPLSMVRHRSIRAPSRSVIDPSAPRHGPSNQIHPSPCHGPSSIHPRPVTVRHRSIRAVTVRHRAVQQPFVFVIDSPAFNGLFPSLKKARSGFKILCISICAIETHVVSRHGDHDHGSRPRGRNP